MKKLEQVVSAAQRALEDPADFLELVEKHHCRSDPFDVPQFLQVIPKKLHSQLWESLLHVTLRCSEQLQTTAELDDEAAAKETLEVMAAVCTFVQGALCIDKPPLHTAALLDTLGALHDVLLCVPEEGLQLQTEIVGLCEAWWRADLPDRERLVPHTVSFLLASSLYGTATLPLVKRVYGMKEGLLVLEFEDESADSLKSLLLTCFIHPTYIKSQEGCKFLSFVFGLQPSFISDIHQTIKNHIPGCPRAYLEGYGQVYLRAWKAASGVYRQVIEEKCMQDLMYVAIHAPRGGPHSLFAAVRTVLAPFHRQQRGTGDTVHTLYQPFLWRSLKVANQDVRANAVCLLSDAFPVLHASMDREERDTALQRQFDLFKDLLEDPSVTVRCAATAGVCRILGSYWELVPPPVIRSLLKRLLGDLARDAASVSVRVAVVQGLCVILENRLTHPLLKELLPLLANHIHDTSEKVRIALLDLLILVKGMKAIKFWEVVPVEDLLVRMELDSAPVAKRITSLLLDSFQPLDKGRQEQLERCIALIRSSPSAARKFYQQAQKHLTLAVTARFMMAINACLVHVVEGDSGSGDEEEELSMQDTPIIAGLLEVLVILWEGARESLAKPSSKPVHSKLVATFSSSVPLFFNAFTERPCHSALVLLAANLPHKAASSISVGFLELLKSFSPDTPAEEYGPLLVAMVTWKQAVPVLKLIASWLEHGILATSDPAATDGVNGGGDNNEFTENSKKRLPEKGRRGKAGGGRGVTKPIAADNSSLHHTKLALLYIKWMLAHPVCLQELVQVKQFWELKSILQKGMGGVEQVLGPSGGGSLMNREVCLDMLQLYWRVVLLQVTQSVAQDETCYCEDIHSLVVWCEGVCGQAIRQASLLEGQEGMGRLRKRKMATTAPPSDLSERDQAALQVAQVVLECFSECVLTGVFPLELRDTVSKMAADWLSSALGGRLLSRACKLLYQLNETLVGEGGQEGVSTGNEDLVRGILSITRKEMGRDHSSKTLSLVRPVLSVCVDTSVGVYHLAEDPALPCPPVVSLLVDSILADMQERLRAGPAAVAWPTSTEDMSDFIKGITQIIGKGAETKSFFMSSLVSVVSKPKPDQDCADELLLYLAVLHIVMGTLPMWKVRVASVTGLFSDIATFTDRLSEENKERLQDVVALVRAGLQLAQDRLAMFL